MGLNQLTKDCVISYKIDSSKNGRVYFIVQKDERGFYIEDNARIYINESNAMLFDWVAPFRDVTRTKFS